MSDDGLEIDMLSLGDANSILVAKWLGIEEVAIRVLIDGGNCSDTEEVRTFLDERGVTYIDHIVCSHPHDDHAGGLVALVQDSTMSFGRAWVHKPRDHVNARRLENALVQTKEFTESVVARKALGTTDELLQALATRGVPVAEPFAGQVIGCLSVAGPTQAYYEELIEQFADADKIRSIEIESLKSFLQEATEPDGLLENPSTDPENNSSTILTMTFRQDRYLFTSDAGVDALTRAASTYDLSDLNWMEIPHHGSRRNITRALIEKFSPHKAFVSAVGSDKHPREAVVSAFKEQGAQVYSTHLNAGGIWHHRGSHPDRQGYVPATPL